MLIRHTLDSTTQPAKKAICSTYDIQQSVMS